VLFKSPPAISQITQPNPNANLQSRRRSKPTTHPRRAATPRSGFVQPCAAANPAGASRLQSLRPVRRVAELGSFGDMTNMKSRTIVLAILCAVLNGIAGWSAFHGPDWLTNAIMLFIAVAVLGLIVNLYLHKGDWQFRAPAFALVGASLSFMAFELWQFYTHAD
jgi:hypothetical protein